MLEALYPQPLSYQHLRLEALPILALIAVRFLCGDIKDRDALHAIRRDKELKALDYYQFRTGVPRDILFRTPALLFLLGYRKGVRGKSEDCFIEEYRALIETERRQIKNNTAAPFRKSNIMSVGRLSFTLCLGAFYLKYAHHDLETIAAKIAEASQSSASRCCPVRLMRYLLNGARAEFFPYDASFSDEREVLARNYRDHLEYVARVSGMRKERFENLCAMVVEGIKVAVRKEASAQKEARNRRILPAPQLGMFGPFPL